MGVLVGVRGKRMWTKICTVFPPSHDGGNRRGRHDELGYRSSAPKASAAEGGSVHDKGRGRLSDGHHDGEKKEISTLN